MPNTRTLDIVMAQNYGLLTANIFYHLPDYPGILKEFILQKYDVAPDFPVLCSFLGFWAKKIDGPLHSVVVVHAKLIKPAEFKEFKIEGGKIRLH